MLLIYTTPILKINQKDVGKLKKSAIIGNINQRLLNNTNSENKSKLVLTSPKRFDIIIAQVKTKATSQNLNKKAVKIHETQCRQRTLCSGLYTLQKLVTPVCALTQPKPNP